MSSDGATPDQVPPARRPIGGVEDTDSLPDWALGPFTVDPEPVLEPTDRGWESGRIFNLSLIEAEDTLFAFYRATPDDRIDQDSRIGLAWSDDGRQGTFYLETGEQPRGNTVIYDRTDAAVTTATPAELPVASVENAAGFHTTGITPALSDTLSETTAALLAAAQEAGTTTSFDCNYRSKLWSPAEARETLTELLDDVDVFTVAERDARNVFEKSGESADIANELAETFDLEVTILTRGTDPALAVSAGDVYEQPTFESTDAHPVGTGDSFVGGFLSQYLDGHSLPDSLEYAAATAAFKRTVPGDIAVVSPEEVEAVIDGATAGISR
jgi:2-dehydro-3-deoxygluconokinase